MYLPLAGTIIGEAFCVAWNTPPSSTGLYTSSAPASAAIFGSWVQAR